MPHRKKHVENSKTYEGTEILAPEGALPLLPNRGSRQGERGPELNFINYPQMVVSFYNNSQMVA